MKFYESGDNRKPVIFLFPGTCCLYNSFDHVLDGLYYYFYTVAVSYDGFDPNEKTEFYSLSIFLFCFYFCRYDCLTASIIFLYVHFCEVPQLPDLHTFHNHLDHLPQP